jgi:hypothetical protein
MAVIAPTSLQGTGSRVVTETTLTGTDSFVYKADRKAILQFDNPTAGALSPIIDGDGGTTVSVPGVGQVSVAGGYAVGSIAAGASVAIPLDSISAYLVGTIGVTDGTGLVARLLEQ